MAIACDYLLPIPPDTTPGDRINRLQRLKHALIGHPERKLVTLRSRVVPSDLVHALQSLVHATPSGWTGEDVYQVSLEAATILGALSMATVESCSILLRSQAHSTLLSTLVLLSSASTVSSCVAASELSPPRHAKLVEAVLRAIKSLYIDLVRVVGPRTWGTDLIGDPVAPGERADVGLEWEVAGAVDVDDDDDMMIEEDGHADNKGKGKDLTIVNSSRDHARTLRRDARLALTELYSTSSPALSHLIQCLLNVVQTDPSIPGSTRLRPAPPLKLAEMVCTLLGGTVRTEAQRSAVLGIAGSLSTFRALDAFIRLSNGRVQESAIQALSALVRDFRELPDILDTLGPKDEIELFQTLHSLTQSSASSLRMAATTARIILFNTERRFRPGLAPDISQESLIPVLLQLVSNEPSLRAQATFCLAYLVAGSEDLQRTCVKLKALDVLRTVLENPTTLQQPYATASSIEESGRTSEGALICIACLCSLSEQHRHEVLAARLLPLIVASLEHRSAGVRAAACHCLRGLARSVNVLRTSLVDAGAARPLVKLLRDDEDVVVKVTAVATLSNLLLEFSPTREVVIDQGCIPRIAEMTHSPVQSLVINALWSLKNASYQSSPTFKRTLMTHLTWSRLSSLINSPDPSIAEQALGILRNLTCTTGHEPITGLLDSEMGETLLLDSLERGLKWIDHPGVGLQALYCLVNLATANERAKSAIIGRVELLKTVVGLLSSAIAETRCGAVWTIINLAHVPPAPPASSHVPTPHPLRSGPSRPSEIVRKLRAMGVEDRLRRMSEDESLDVRERVRDALDGFQGVV